MTTSGQSLKVIEQASEIIEEVYEQQVVNLMEIDQKPDNPKEYGPCLSEDPYRVWDADQIGRPVSP